MTKSEKKEGEGKLDKVGDFLQERYHKGELALKHAAGLGRTPSVIPVGTAEIDGPPRPVEVGWHPVGGGAGKWFNKDTALGKMITQNINKYPDPTQHWAVLVGEYAHQLWMDENFDVIYTNQKIVRSEWQTFSVGETRFNDDALWRTGEHVINTIREKQPAYNLITNNCQTYALKLLDAIKVGAHKEFGTTLAVYERLVGPGSVKALFAKQQEQAANSTAPGTSAAPGDDDTVSIAQHVMDSNTTQLDTQEQMDKHKAEGAGGSGDDRSGGEEADGDRGMDGDKKKHRSKREIFSRFLPS